MASISSAALSAPEVDLAVSCGPIVPPVWATVDAAVGVAAGMLAFCADAVFCLLPVPHATIAPPTAVIEAERRNARRLVGASARVASVSSSCDKMFDIDWSRVVGGIRTPGNLAGLRLP